MYRLEFPVGGSVEQGRVKIYYDFLDTEIAIHGGIMSWIDVGLESILIGQLFMADDLIVLLTKPRKLY